jgi:hypothetical protein
MDFILRPKSKILKILRNLNHNVSEATCASVLRWMERKKRRTPILLGPCWRLALSKGPNRVAVLLFFLSIHLRTEAEPASETL